jgi:hypothetical protein
MESCLTLDASPSARQVWDGASFSLLRQLGPLSGHITGLSTFILGSGQTRLVAAAHRGRVEIYEPEVGEVLASFVPDFGPGASERVILDVAGFEVRSLANTLQYKYPLLHITTWLPPVTIRAVSAIASHRTLPLSNPAAALPRGRAAEGARGDPSGRRLRGGV